MKRRKLLAAASAAGTVTLPGCGIFEYQPDSGGSDGENAEVASNEAEVAVDHLTRIFDRLASFEVLGPDGTVVATTETYTEADLSELRQELSNAEAALENMKEAESTPSTDRETVEAGVLLAAAQLTIYTRLRRALAREAPLLDAVGASNYSVANDEVSQARLELREVWTTAQEAVAICERFREEEVPAPEGYRLDAAKAEAETFVGLESRAKPIFSGLEAWTQALVRGVAGKELFEDEKYRSAEVSFQQAEADVDTASDRFGTVDIPVMYADAYKRGACRLEELEFAFSTAKLGAEAAADGRGETGQERFGRYEERFDEYKAECGTEN